MSMTIEQQQCYLTAMGFYKLKRKDGSPAVDGLGGPATKQAVYNFQLAYKIPADGVWGPQTEAKLREVIGKNLPPVHPDPAPIKPHEPGKYKWVSRDMFKCRCGGKYCNGWPAEVDEKELELLEQVGEYFQSPIIPHSGLRCVGWNADPQVGGAPNSKHIYGLAMDFHIDGVTPKELYDVCDKILGNSGGLGLYSWGVHMDSRPVKGRW